MTKKCKSQWITCCYTKQEHESISNLVKEFEAKEKATKEMYEKNISRQLAKVKEAFEIEKNNTMEKLQQKQSIEIEKCGSSSY